MKFRLFYPICIAALMLLLTAIGVMGMIGYRLIEGSVVYILFGLLVTMAVGGLAVWLTRKTRTNGLRILVGVISTMVVSAVVLGMFVFFSFVDGFYTPQLYTTLESESGRKVAVLRQLSQQYAYDRAKDSPDSALRYEDLGYSYQIYPVFSKFFYNSKLSAEGTLEIGCVSTAQLMHEWNGDSLHMYIADPQEFDLGELILR